MTTDQIIYDCTIIGGGPIGLFAAFYAGLREMSVKIIDSLEELGGQLTALYPEKWVYDVGGFPKVKAKDLAAGCVAQAMQFHPTICVKEKVIGMEPGDDGVITLTTDRGIHRTRTAIITAGVGAFAPRKLERVPELDALEGKSVFYFVKDIERFRGKRLLLVGGGDSAMDWALNLEPLATSITLIHRRDRWRAHEDTVNKVMASSVDVRIFHELKSVATDADGKLTGATIFNNKTNEEITLALDYLILNLGFVANIGPIKGWSLELERNGVVVDSTMATNLPGVYAAGDITRYRGKLELIATGFGEAAIAANYAKNYIDPNSRVFPGHSSELEAPPGG